MRTVFISLALILGLPVVYATNPKNPGKSDLDWKKISKSFCKIPDLTVFKEENGKQVEAITLHMYNQEVTNVLYREFLKDLQTKGATERLKMAAVDTTGWVRHLKFCEPYVVHYFRHPAYNNYPVVNITQAGALLFCEWLTEKYYTLGLVKKGYKVSFRLPTAAEWTIAAKGGDEKAIYPWGGYYVRGSNGDFQANFLHVGEENITMKDGKIELVPKSELNYSKDGLPGDNADLTAPSGSYWPNAYGLYNMSGNVAEMVMEQGHTKGGSFHNTGYEIRIDAPDNYPGILEGSPYIGFRVIMVVEKTQG